MRKNSLFVKLLVISFIFLPFQSMSKEEGCIKIIKNRMEVFKKYMEIYANSNKGEFPHDLFTLSLGLPKKEYNELIKLKNPYYKEYGYLSTLFDYQNYYLSAKYKKNKTEFACLVLYEPLQAIGNEKLAPKEYTYGKYRIYGTDEKGELIKKDGKPIFLERKKFHPKADLKYYKMFHPNKKVVVGND